MEKTNNFINAMETEVAWKTTENGQTALNTTFDKCVDLFATIGALRTRSDGDIEVKFAHAYDENSLLAVKMMFYARDIDEGLGERRVFRVCLRWLANSRTKDVEVNLANIVKYGRMDDLYTLAGTPVEKKAFEYMRNIFLQDIENYNAHKSISLLAKWLKSVNTSNEESNKLGKLTAKYFGLTEKNYRKTLALLRRYLNVTEVDMSTNNWEKIDFTKVPGGAMKKYLAAFKRHQEERFAEYLDAVKNNKTVVVNGKEVEAKMNTKKLFPYEIISTYTAGNGTDPRSYREDLEVMWKNLKDVIQGVEYNGIVIADVSGSMCGQPMCSSVGLAIYFAEHNKGAYHNKFMTFSSRPTWISLADSMTLQNKIKVVSNADWGGSTNLEAALDMILNVGLSNHLSQDDMPQSLIIVTDMEFNSCVSDNCSGSDLWGCKPTKMTFYDTMKKKYNNHGYEIPTIIFWNVNARNDTYHAQANVPHVAMVSGQATNVFNDLIQGVIKTPVDHMLEVLNKERYNSVVIAE